MGAGHSEGDGESEGADGEHRWGFGGYVKEWVGRKVRG